MTMAIGGLGTQAFGAAVASETLDILNNSGGGSGMLPADKASVAGALVSKTLNNMNSGTSAGDPTGMAQSYDFQQAVLGAHATGSLLDSII
ncbi:hypothetical protein [Pseudodesulfovibrio sp.]|uniref:hypothetical protein n=1 Tax=Pseudodesulfovibrio sp. TaxID=2035812 RepID=UPI00262259AB|nr:hypothetical protein [Pseudodesulfovibrio sp.]MDD3313720.1 hypothetical protein [Pseudodesulfovibrio sp.]